MKNSLKQNQLESDFRPVAYGNINIYPLYAPEDNYYVVGSKDKDEYLLCDADSKNKVHDILCNSVGELTISEIATASNVTIEETQKIIMLCANKGLLKNVEPKNVNEVQKLALPLISFSCKNFFEFIKIHIRIIQICILGSFIVALIANSFFLLKGNFITDIGKNTHVDLLASFLFMIPSFLIHEIFHGIAAARHRLIATKLNFVLYLCIFPMAYLKIPDMYTLHYRNRIRILLSGFLGNIYLMNLSIFLAYVTHNRLFIILLMAQLNIIACNILPLQLTDSYFIFSTILKTPNLRYNFLNFIGNPKQKPKQSVLIYSTLSIVFMFFSVVYFVSRTFSQLSYLYLFSICCLICGTYLGIIFLKYKKTGVTF